MIPTLMRYTEDFDNATQTLKVLKLEILQVKTNRFRNIEF